MARVVVAGAGAIGASIAYHLAERGAKDVVLADAGEVASGATAKAMGGVRQQFSTAAEVRLAQSSIRFFESLGRPFFEQVGYLFVATTEEGLAVLEERRAVQVELGVPAERVDASRVPGLRTDDVVGAVACWQDGCADPQAVARELVRRAVANGVELRERTDALSLDGRRARDRLRALVGRGCGRARSRATGAAVCASCSHRAARASGRPADGGRGRDRLSLPPSGRPARARDDGRVSALGLRGARRRVGVRRPARAPRSSLSTGGGRRRSPTPGRASTT